MNRAQSTTAGLMLATVCLYACDDRAPLAERIAGTTAASASAAPSTKKSAKPKPSASASAKKRQMPPRPVPLGSSGPIQPSDPPQKQMMAIHYTLAMIASHPGDPLLDRDEIDALAKKMSVGNLKAAPQKGHRLLALDIKGACTAALPKRMATTRGGVSLDDLFRMGVNVIMCKGNKWACHQSTRDPKDVLCLFAGRRR